MKVLLTSAGLETDEIQKYFMNMLGKDMSLVKALFIPTAAVSAGSLIFSNNLPGNLGLINTKLDVHCAEGEKRGKIPYPLKDHLRLTNTCALAIRDFPEGLEIIGE